MAHTKIGWDAHKAFVKRKNFKRANTEVHNGVLYLFGNPIVKDNGDGSISISNCGHYTLTTKERLSHFVNLFQRDHIWYLEGKEWDKPSQWTKVTDWKGKGSRNGNNS